MEEIADIQNLNVVGESKQYIVINWMMNIMA